ncbi:uncharacterized protein [Gossypium hirsutum]|uniref:D-isomer specific 2-hydroxyacid dehydrogenase NAD-binding domain-containing protein n=1 Tax=Gossypium hirsutum TaxID=3635 RepID=A0A1U8N7W1_GOSHI|nr:uncharacterized protein LOC107944567 [Gossypium hirsutum]
MGHIRPEPWKYLLNVLGFRAKWQSRFFSFNVYKNATVEALLSPPLVKSSPRMLLNLLLGFSSIFSDEFQPVIGMSGPDRGSQKEHTRQHWGRSRRKPGRSIGRGGLIDEKELAKFLVQGRVGGADLDVYEDEPHVPPELFAMDNIVLAPHAAVYTPESFEALQELVIGNLKALFSDQPLISPAQLK